MKETTQAQRLRPLEMEEVTALPQPPANVLTPLPLFSSSSSSFPSSSSLFPSGSSSLYSSVSCPCSSVSSSLPSFFSSSHPFTPALPSASSSSTDTSVSCVSPSSSSSGTAGAGSSPASCAVARGGEAESASTAAATGEGWEEHPLFMASMPTGEAFQRNSLLAALAAVIDEEEQLPFEAQRRRGIERRRRQEERDERELTKTVTRRNANFLFPTGETPAEDFYDGGLISTHETKAIPAFDGRTATTATEGRNKERKSTQPTPTPTTLSRHRSSCMPYAASSQTLRRKQNPCCGRCEDSDREMTECSMPLQGTTLKPQGQQQKTEASPSMGELHICMKMWSMGK